VKLRLFSPDTMFFHVDIKADGLPPGTVCLTYDDGPGATTGDGPGPRTEELAEYLFARGIAATFFVIGRHAECHRDLLGRLTGWGHLIGNHTYSHPGLANLAASGGDVIGEIARTDEIIGPYIDSDVKFLRPPYGNWRETRESGGELREEATSIVARALNGDGRFRNYVGPINWDISGQDYDFWRQGLPAEECARRYLERIRHAGRGVILMHDSSEDEEMRSRNRTYEVTKPIVPIFESEGYRFVRLDAIPQVSSAMSVSSVIALRTEEDRFLGWSDQPRGCIVAEARSVGAREQFGVVALDAERMALRASNGSYLTARPRGEGKLQPTAPSLDEALVFHRQTSGDDRIMLLADHHAMIHEPGGTVRWLPASRSRDQQMSLIIQDLFE
jgi:peptidoglycan/xylan/chitin deacetylase (PgdA/CDA1 family)